MLHSTSWVDSRPKFSWEEPETQEPEAKEVFKLQVALNSYLAVDGWEIYVDNYISEEPLYQGKGKQGQDGIELSQ